MAREVTCLHRHLSAIPGGRFACSDDLGCRSVFTLTTDGEVEHLRAMYAEGVELIREGISVVDDLMGSVDTLMAQRDAARDAARICEQALATRGSRLDTEKWNPPKATRAEMAAREQEFNDACPAGSVHQWRRFKDGAGGHTKCILCGIRRVEDAHNV